MAEIQMCVASVLGVMQVLVGLVNVGLGPGRTHVRPGDVAGLWAAYWLGAVFTVSGLFTIVSGTFRSPWLTRSLFLLNLLGALFSVVGLVLYSLDLAHAPVAWICDRRVDSDPCRSVDSDPCRSVDSDPCRSVDSDPCRTVAEIAQRALSWMDVSLLVLLVLQLCVNISAVVLSFSRSREEQGGAGRSREEQGGAGRSREEQVCKDQTVQKRRLV